MDNPYLFEYFVKCCAAGYAAEKDYKSICSLALLNRASRSIVNPILIELEAVPTETDWLGGQYWYKNRNLHRDGDKPAAIRSDGTQFWYKNGKIHRDGDEPAKIYPNGAQLWYKHGELHRDGDKPAVINPNGTTGYWRDGVRYYP